MSKCKPIIIIIFVDNNALRGTADRQTIGITKVSNNSQYI